LAGGRRRRTRGGGESAHPFSAIPLKIKPKDDPLVGMRPKLQEFRGHTGIAGIIAAFQGNTTKV
jgi:hypothetical protein